ncbi:MAG: DUF2339 domain-containing protein [Alphaproteobacteria bacterium]|nr:MAG: DUF2339 domain-containing protein [Alphaproteobacteria bacterium]
MDDGIIGLLILIALGIFFSPLILAIVALSRTGDLRRKLAALEARLAFEQPGGAPAEAAPETEIPAAAPGRVWAEARQPEEKVVEAEPSPGPVIEEVEPVEAAQSVPPPPPPPRAGIEERLTSRWLVWLGAVALVLAGIFLIKYSIDNALLTPAMRATFGLALGVVLTLAGEWLRRRPLQRELASLKPDYVPGALTSAGLFICFASIYAAYALLDLLSPTIAFIGLAIVALVAFALAALHSPIVAIIGLLAGFATPALVSSSEPNAGILFAYLALMRLGLARLWRDDRRAPVDRPLDHGADAGGRPSDHRGLPCRADGSGTLAGLEADARRRAGDLAEAASARRSRIQFLAGGDRQCRLDGACRLSRQCTDGESRARRRGCRNTGLYRPAFRTLRWSHRPCGGSSFPRAARLGSGRHSGPAPL